MAVSTLILTTPKPLAQIQRPNPSPTTSLSASKPTSTCSCSSSSFSATANNAYKSSWKFSNILSMKSVMDVGMGLLASSIMALSPLEADATRIEYYATVGEPLCDLNFVRSGLGFCDVSVGPGVEAPRGELINVSSQFLLSSALCYVFYSTKRESIQNFWFFCLFFVVVYFRITSFASC